MAESPELPPDVLDKIMTGFNLKELVCLKGVCMSWYTTIPTTRFHLNHLKYNNDQNNNNDVGDTRVFMPRSGDHPNTFSHYDLHDSFFDIDESHLLGSSNGLVCISPSRTQVLVANPFTKEVRKLQDLPISYRESFCWGFGYDSSTDDYKIIVGSRKGKNQTFFQVLSLRTNVWKVIGEVTYSFFGRSGVLCNGALHWFVDDEKMNHVILSFDLTKEEFQEIPQPNDPSYICTYNTYLGVFKDCLCIFHQDNFHYPTWVNKNYDVFPLWVMKNYNVKESWELQPHKPDMNNDSAHSLRNLRNYNRIKKSMFNDHICSSTTGEYIGAPLYVQSVVSPYINGKLGKKRRARNNERKVKLIKGDPTSSEV